MAQRRLSSLWGGPPAMEMKISEVAKSAEAQIDKEEKMEKLSATEQMPYVPNGSRDRVDVHR